MADYLTRHNVRLTDLPLWLSPCSPANFTNLTAGMRQEKTPDPFPLPSDRTIAPSSLPYLIVAYLHALNDWMEWQEEEIPYL